MYVEFVVLNNLEHHFVDALSVFGGSPCTADSRG